MTDEQRATIFGGDADRYDQYRPSYPDVVIDVLVESGPTRAVDVGCGTGKAAVLVAARGVEVIGVEPDERMATVARRHGIEVSVSSVEAWEPAECDLMYAAQSWHWVDHERGGAVAASSVRPGGRWVGFWNYERDDLFTAARSEAYRRVAPRLVDDAVVAVEWGDDMFMTSIDDGLRATGAFEALVADEVAWTDHITVEVAVARLATHSAHRLLEPEVSAAIDRALVAELGAPTDPLDLAYVTRIFTAARR